MKTSPLMQAIITEIAAKHGLDLSTSEAHLRLEMPGYDRLVIENIGRNRVSVAHYFEQNGDLCADPDVVFFTGDAQWIAIEVTQIVTGYSQIATLTEDSTAIKTFYLRPQADLAEFAEIWATNIREQGWLEHGQRPQDATR